MPKNKTPRQEPTPDDYRDAAEDSLELAKVLAGAGAVGDQDFLQRMARSADLVDHDGETCSMCHNMILGAHVGFDEAVFVGRGRKLRRRIQASQNDNYTCAEKGNTRMLFHDDGCEIGKTRIVASSLRKCQG